MTTLSATDMGKTLAETRSDGLKAIELVECACSTHRLMPDSTRMNLATVHGAGSCLEPLDMFVGIVSSTFQAAAI